MHQRHQLIVAKLSEQSRVSVGELAALAGTSEMTIRRDLELLEGKGVLRRVHGGAVGLLLRGAEPPFAVRALADSDVKDKLAAATVGMLADGETVVLDTGTTATAIAHAMGERQLRVTPLSLHGAQVLAGRDTVELLMPGGQVRPGELSLVGELAERTFDELRYDTFILGCCGIDAVNGATAYNLDDVRVKRAAIRSCQRTIAVVTAEKLGRVTSGQICPIQRIDLVITSAPAHSAAVEELTANGVSVMTV